MTINTLCQAAIAIEIAILMFLKGKATLGKASIDDILKKNEAGTTKKDLLNILRNFAKRLQI